MSAAGRARVAAAQARKMGEGYGTEGCFNHRPQTRDVTSRLAGYVQ
jgi:hypothetical protein